MLRAERLRVVGAMSGTSLDGVDAAMVRTDGRGFLEFGPTAYRPYSRDERAVIAAALGHWPGEPGVAAAAEVVGAAHGALLSGFEGAELIGFHGQTLAHDPRGRGTHQAGDGQALAARLGVPVVWDFRSEDIEAGGEGAPLAPFFHHACARHLGLRGAVAFLNLGGVGNLTWVDTGREQPEEDGALIAFDTGPANAPLDDLVMERRQWRFDAGGALAAEGRADQRIVADVLGRAWFRRAPPKSLDRDDFAGLRGAVRGLDDADAAATLTAVAAASAARGLEHCPTRPERVLVTGGGRRNPVLMAMLAALAGCPVGPVEDVGLNGDMLEAQAFAWLAVRVARGVPTSAPGTTGVRRATCGGRVSAPSG